jgi:hypothetical protein
MSTESKQPSFVSYQRPTAEREGSPGKQKGGQTPVPKGKKQSLPELRGPFTTLAIGEEGGWPPWW